MNTTYEDLENELIDFLEPLKPALPQFCDEVFDQVLNDAVDMVVPEDDDAIIQVAKSHPSMCIATQEIELYSNLTHIIRDTISLKLHKCGWGWYMVNKEDKK